MATKKQVKTPQKFDWAIETGYGEFDVYPSLTVAEALERAKDQTLDGYGPCTLYQKHTKVSVKSEFVFE